MGLRCPIPGTILRRETQDFDRYHSSTTRTDKLDGATANPLEQKEQIKRLTATRSWIQHRHPKVLVYACLTTKRRKERSGKRLRFNASTSQQTRQNHSFHDIYSLNRRWSDSKQRASKSHARVSSHKDQERRDGNVC